MSGWLPPAAHISAFWSRKVSTAFTSAPRSTSSFEIGSEPMLTASISAVWLSRLGEFTSAPASSSRRHQFDVVELDGFGQRASRHSDW